MSSVAGGIDGIEAVFDDASLVADAGLLLAGTVMGRLGLEALIDDAVRPPAAGRGSGAKALSVVASMLVGGSFIGDADRLRAGSASAVLGFEPAAPSTLGTWLRSFTWGHVRQFDRALELALSRAWSSGAAPAAAEMTVDLDSTVCEVHGKSKQGAAYGHTKVWGYHPLAATRDDTGEVLHARMRSGSSQRGHVRFAAETLARLGRLAPGTKLTVRADAGFFSYALIAKLDTYKARWSVTIPQNAKVKAAIDGIDETAWTPIAYPDGKPRSPSAPSQRAAATPVAPESCASWCAAPDSQKAPNASCGPTGATTRSSRTETTSTPKPPTPTTAATPESSSPSETSKTTASPTAPPEGSSPTPPTSPAPCWPTTSPAGPHDSDTHSTPNGSPQPPPSAGGCSPCPDASSTTATDTNSASRSTGPGHTNSPPRSHTPATSPTHLNPQPRARRHPEHTPLSATNQPSPNRRPNTPQQHPPHPNQPNTPTNTPTSPPRPAHRWIQA